MAKLSATNPAKDDAKLITTLNGVYKTVGYSPTSKIETILRNSHENFRALVRALVRQLVIEQQDAPALDKVIMHPTIKPMDGWVSNVARLSERCIAEQIADELLATTAVIAIEDVKREVLGKLNELIELRDARQTGYRAYEIAVTQAHAAGMAAGRIPPPLPLPNGLIPPSDAFPLTRLQPKRGVPIKTPTWKP